jgi:hypothetical protein
MTIIEAEKAWRKAWDQHDRYSTVQNYRAEQEAWDTYVELCNEVEQCQQPGCRKYVPEYAYCQEHRL